MERDIIYYHIAIQQIEQLNKQSIFIKLNDHYHIYKKHKSKCPYDVEETNKPEILRHKKKLELKAIMGYFESVDYCLLDIWIDNKSFGQLGELTSILFEDFGLSIGLSRDPRKNWGPVIIF